MSQFKLALIDVDGLYYQSARDTIEDSIQSFADKFQNILDKTEATHYIGFYSKGRYFRHDIDKDYKGNRKSDPPKFMRTLKEWSIAEYGFQTMSLVEADDLIAYWYRQDICAFNNLDILDFDTREAFDGAKFMMSEQNAAIFKYESVQKIIVSPDKDILQAIEGKHFNYTYKLEDKDNPDSLIKGWWVETSGIDAIRFRHKQCLIGDTSDNIKTPFPESAGDWFVKSGLTFGYLLEAYILGFNYETPTGMKKFAKGYGTSKGLYEFQKNYRLLHLLETNEDFNREVGCIPVMPKAVEVKEIVDKSEQTMDF